MIFGLEPWFVCAVASTIIGGFGNFGNKIAAERKYDSNVVMVLSAWLTFLLFLPFAILYTPINALSWFFFGIVFLSGFVTSFSAIMKIQALHYIDSAIFLPLYKVCSPLIVIVFGLVVFSERFTPIEWFGLLISLTIPFLLISRIEHTRQNDLKTGLVMVVIGSLIGAIGVSIKKYATDISDHVLLIMVIASIGVLTGSVTQHIWKRRQTALQHIKDNMHRGVWTIALMRSAFASTGLYLALLAFELGGPLGIVYTINSLYILIPIILAIVIYGEHWNLRKVFAIALSIFALALFQ